MTSRGQLQTPSQNYAVLFPTIESIASLRDPVERKTEADASPSEAAVAHAILWVGHLFEYLTSSESRWIPPLVSDSVDGGVMFEWWNHERRRKLTVYVWDQETEYVQVWGPNMINEMAEGSAEPLDAFASVWAWLTQ